MKFWAAVNKNRFLTLFTDQPKRNVETGRWEGKIYVNSIVYKTIKDLFDKVDFNWEKDAEYFEIENKDN